MTKWADINHVKVGDTASCEVLVDDRAVEAFAVLSGDNNALHMETAVAVARGFPTRVAHGMLALGAISRLIGTELPGHGSLWASEDLQFRAPVLVGDTVTARVTVEQVSHGAQMVKLRTEVVNTITGAVVLIGSAKVRIPPRQETTSA